MISPPSARPISRLRSIVSGSIGNLVEWYDWYAYSAFALYFAPVFFPKGSPTAQLLNTAAIFAVGFLMRPLGAWMLGAYADRHGRKAALLLSVRLMAGGSLLIAATPGFARIGVAAPALLLLARLIQGISVGGEYGTSATYLSEMAGARHRGFWSSFQYLTLMGGQLLALVVQLGLQRVLTPAELGEWGWRIPFVIGAVAAIGALYLRTHMGETAAFEEQQHGLVAARAAGVEQAPAPPGQMRRLMQHPRAVMTVVGLTLGGTLAFYTFTTYAQKFLVNTSGFTKEMATLISFSVMAVALLFQPLLGALSDRVGRRPVLLMFGIGATLGTVPLLRLLAQTQDAWVAAGLLVAALFVVSGYTSISAVVKAELFPTEIRALGVGLPFALTVAIFGGTAEYVALFAKNQGVEEWFYWYVTVCSFLSLLVYWRMSETQKNSRMAPE
ncbi:MFS transporter [Hymenobacter arizonensis]|uniref:MFS transporter, MHS family, alpha-ketoglutarate permease n=1 Tax=Hymenobacter arizonensis TaxID=1227077 RepID=A0A1I5TZJ8_HYMAR|nr:MFS transporter [Hymenobacter arizonensis]SFP88490.1 MFS transporter, MHS family, alpha-ketoglutarate permease [Hymenobacter arizonensis]